MGSPAGPGATPAYRTPRSAIAFAVVLFALAALYVWVAFVYGHGWSDLVSAVVGVIVIVALFAYFAALAWWWSRGWRRP